MNINYFGTPHSLNSLSCVSERSKHFFQFICTRNLWILPNSWNAFKLRLGPRLLCGYVLMLTESHPFKAKFCMHLNIGKAEVWMSAWICQARSEAEPRNFLIWFIGKIVTCTQTTTQVINNCNGLKRFSSSVATALTVLRLRIRFVSEELSERFSKRVLHPTLRVWGHFPWGTTSCKSNPGLQRLASAWFSPPAACTIGLDRKSVV